MLHDFNPNLWNAGSVVGADEGVGVCRIAHNLHEKLGQGSNLFVNVPHQNLAGFLGKLVHCLALDLEDDWSHTHRIPLCPP